jgi:hypothetical protein
VLYLRPNVAGGMLVTARVISVDNDDEVNGAPVAYTVTWSDGTCVDHPPHIRVHIDTRTTREYSLSFHTIHRVDVLSEDELRDEFNLGSYDFLGPKL